MRRIIKKTEDKIFNWIHSNPKDINIALRKMNIIANIPLVIALSIIGVYTLVLLMLGGFL